MFRDGIRFALRESDESDHPNLSFLEILSEFSYKLMKQDRTHLCVSCIHSHSIFKFEKIIIFHLIILLNKICIISPCQSVSCCRLDYLHRSCESASVSSVYASMYERSLHSGARESTAVSPPHTPAKRRRTMESQYAHRNGMM